MKKGHVLEGSVGVLCYQNTARRWIDLRGSGQLAGGVVGATVGLMLINQDYWLPVTKSGLFYLSVAVGVLGGLLTGAGMGRDYVYKIEGKKPEELKNILKELRSEARLTNVK